VNTGWTGGPYGTGHRIAIEDSRAIVDSILGGALDGVQFTPDPNFGIAVPAHVPGVADELLAPRSTWPDPHAYDRKAAELAGMFRANFATLSDEAPERAHRGAPPAP